MSGLLDKLKLGNEVVAATATAVGLFVGLLFGKILPPTIPLFYSRPWGEEQLASPLWLSLPLGMAITVTLGTLLANKFLKNEPILATIIMTSGIMIGIILILATLRNVILVV
jgi:hypothetical protein